MVGKLSKLAAGVMMTHWTRSKVDNDLLAGHRRGRRSAGLVEEIKDANTARHAYELWREAGLDEGSRSALRARRGEPREYREEKLEVHVVMVDFDTLDPAGASPGALALTTWEAGEAADHRDSGSDGRALRRRLADW